MSQQTRILVNFTTKEIELEGTEEFVREHLPKIPEILALVRTAPGTPAPLGKQSATPASTTGMPFGEYYQTFPTKDLKEVDRFLIAAAFIQGQSEDNTFDTAAANKLLKDNAIKIANPSDSREANVAKGYAFKVAGRKHRVSQPGFDHLTELKSQQ